jgi:uncharacterized membrane protein
VSEIASGRVVDHGSSRLSRWLRARRIRFALWIAVLEAVLVAIFHDVTKWTVIALAIVACAVYFGVARNSRSDSLRQLGWIFAASQVLAVIAAIVSFIVIWGVIIAIIAFAVVALVVLMTDRR